MENKTDYSEISQLPLSKLKKLMKRDDIEPGFLSECIGLSYSLDRLIACHPRATKPILEKLALSHDSETRKNVISNSVTPAEVLIELAPEFPREFFCHPLLDVMILEDPMMLSRLKPGVLKAFLQADDCPVSFIRWACSYGNRTDHLEILKRKDIDVECLKAIARGSHPKTAERAIERLIELGETW